MSNYYFSLPSDFENYEWEVTAKGYFSEAILIVSGKRYCLNFYDAVRLGQEIESQFEVGGVFFEKNVVVVRSVTKIEMEMAAAQLVKCDYMSSLVHEPEDQDREQDRDTHREDRDTHK